ncbi:MAG: GNAT family N-acetyltransferase [Armatimonadota bacterium]|nr:GNAT family N-acetyltransferase [Armatimonadota bacterium]
MCAAAIIVLLATERLALRRFTAADLDNLVALDGDPDVMRFISGEPTPRDVIGERILPRFCQYDERFPVFGFWAVVERTTGRFLGWLSFRPRGDMTAHGEVEIGFRLRRAAWGQGYATEGARALIRVGFAELGVRRVSAVTYEENVVARRVLEKLGFRLTRRFRMTLEDLVATGTFHVRSEKLWDGDDLEYTLDKSEWEGQQTTGDHRRIPGQ